MTKQLTLVGGIRWEPDYMPVDYFNRGTNFSMSAFLANQSSAIYPNAPAGVFFYGEQGIPRAFTKSSPLQFNPNVGFSFDPFGNGGDLVDMTRCATYIDCQHGFALWSNLLLKIVWTHAKCVIDVDKFRYRSEQHDGADATDPHIARQQDFIARSNIQGRERNMKSRSAGIDAECMLSLVAFGPIGFESGDHVLKIEPIESKGAFCLDNF